MAPERERGPAGCGRGVRGQLDGVDAGLDPSARAGGSAGPLDERRPWCGCSARGRSPLDERHVWFDRSVRGRRAWIEPSARVVSGPTGRRETLTVGRGSGVRLDAWLARRLDLSRTRAARLVEQGLVRVEGRPVKKSAPVESGQRVEVEIPPPEPTRLEPQDIPLAVVYEDDALLVVDKPAGLVVHPAPGHPRGTLVNALLHHVTDLAGVGGRLRPGIVHRLDRDTSGLLVVAKHDAAHRALSAELAARKVRRTYLAAAWGHLRDTPMTVDAPIGRDPRVRQRMAVVEGGRQAVTHLRVRERWIAAELLEVRLETGRTHQIRVHLRHIGHPVVGDSVYGAGWERGMAGPARRWAGELSRRAGRQFLHACALSFTHPASGTPLSFQSPLPPDLAEVAEWAAKRG